MRKWYMVVFCLIAALGVLAMMGCDGNPGATGPLGDSGNPGDSGIDLSKLQPEDRPIAVGVTNGTFNSVNGNTSLWMTFDEAARGRPDTLAVQRVSNPPLIDGIDGELAEWGEKQSRLRLAFLNPDPNAQDPNIYDMVMRAAYDDENVYFFIQWKELEVTIRTEEGRDTTLVGVGSSDAARELYFDNSRRIVDGVDETQNPPDTTFFRWLRVDTLSADTVVCIDDPTTPEIDTLECFLTNLVIDSSLVWRSWREGEDRFVLFLNGSEDPVVNWADLAFSEFFDFTGGVNLPADYDVDVWLWGAGTSDPVFVADDWFIDAAGKMPDAGKAPFISNYLLPDSIPMFMHYRDPNFKSALNLESSLFPFWFYDAVGYSRADWFASRSVFVAGFVTTIPNGSRADIYAASSFETATGWVLELKRSRRTNNGDDVIF